MPILDPTLKPPAMIALEEFFKKRLKGQPQAIEALAKAYADFVSGIRRFDDPDKKKPIGIFLFLGPSRVGKTEAGRVLGQFFHGTKRAITLIDCVSYQEKHEIAKLIGAPPGYIGHDEKPRLSKEKLYSKIPGYQITPSAAESNSDKKESKKISNTEDDDMMDVRDAIPFILSELQLIEKALKNIEREFAKLDNLRLAHQEKEGRKDELRTMRSLLNLRKQKLFLHYLEIVVNFLDSEKETLDTPKDDKTKDLAPASNIPVVISKKSEPILIIIFDEIEKAHSSVHQFLLHLMEEGHAILGNGEEIDLSHTFIILTANIGSNLIGRATKGVPQIGFAANARSSNLEKLVQAEVKKLFKPEFLNRLDRTVIFNILSLQDFQDILEMKIEELSHFLQKIGIELKLDPEVKDFILEETYRNIEQQVKSLQDCFKKYLIQPISSIIATNQISKRKKILVNFDPKNKKITFHN